MGLIENLVQNITKKYIIGLFVCAPWGEKYISTWYLYKIYKCIKINMPKENFLYFVNRSDDELQKLNFLKAIFSSFLSINPIDFRRMALLTQM